MRDPYDILGVPRSAPEAEIKKAYRRLAKKHHPDQNPNDAKAKDRFAELNTAYEIVGDAEKRKAFDRGEIDAEGKQRFQQSPFGTGRGAGAGAEGNPFESFEFGFGRQGPYQRQSAGGFAGADFADILSGAFGGRGRGQPQPDMKGEDVEISATVTLEDIAQKAPARVVLPNGRTVEVAIPETVLDNQKMRLRGQGQVSQRSGVAGDAMLTLKIAPHKLFRREGRDIYLDLPLTLDEAVLGAPVHVPTLTGAVELNIPANANDGRTLRLRGKGLTVGKTSGDLLVTLRIRLPENNAGLKALAEELRASGSYKARGSEFD